MGNMVSLVFKQRLFSWFDSYEVTYESGMLAYTIEGKMAWGHLLKVYDAWGMEVAYIKEKVLSFLPKFELFMGDQRVGMISREMTFFKPKYNIDFNGWCVQGDVMGWNYQALLNGVQMMQAQKMIWNFTDTYRIDVPDDQNALCALLVVLAIDAANCSTNSW